MKVSEFIEWLKTQDQEATVQVLVGAESYHEYYTTSDTFNPKIHAECIEKERVLQLGRDL